jgi:hypothetical protein
MIKSRFMKPVMENEEGMNHLWIQLAPIGSADNLIVQIFLPIGLYRNKNFSGFNETEAMEIQITNPLITNDIIIELFTREQVVSGEKTIIVTLTYHENGKFNRIEHFIPLKILPEDEIEEILVDEAVLQKVKELKQGQIIEQDKEFVVYSPTHILRIDPNKLSDLEKKYRIDFYQENVI